MQEKSPRQPPPASFATIPNEVLAWILHHSIVGFTHEPPKWPSTLKWHVWLSKVCKTWRECILETAFLWAHMTSTDNVPLQLELSKEAPLDIDLNLNLKWMKQEDCRNLMELLFDQRHRWRSFSVKDHIGHSTECLTRRVVSFEGSLPITKHLSMVVPLALDWIYLKLVDAPKLRSLHLRRIIPDPARTSQFGSLSSLHIKGLPYSSFGTSSLRTLLSICPALEMFELADIHGPPFPTFTLNENVMGPLCIPRLQHLTLQEAHYYLALSLLRDVSFPSLQTFYPSTVNNVVSQQWLDPITLFPFDLFCGSHLIPKLQRKFTRSAEIEAARDKLVVFLDDYFTLALRSPPYPLTNIRTLVPTLDLKNTPIKLTIDLGSIQSQDFIDLCTIPWEGFNVVELKLVSYSALSHSWGCSTLAARHGAAQLWALPVLETIIIDGPAQVYIDEAVENMLQRRRKSRLGSGNGLPRKVEVTRLSDGARWSTDD